MPKAVRVIMTEEAKAKIRRAYEDCGLQLARVARELADTQYLAACHRKELGKKVPAAYYGDYYEEASQLVCKAYAEVMILEKGGVR